MTARAGRIPAARDTAEQLREATRDAHAAIKDLQAVIRAARQTAEELAERYMARVEAEHRAATEFLQAEQNKHAADLNVAVDAARDAIMQALTLAELTPDPEFRTLKVKFKGGRFDENAEVKVQR